MKFTENVLWIFSEYSQKNIQWIFTNEYSVNFQENSFSEFSVNIPKMQENKRNFYYNFYMTGTVLPINTRKSPFWWEAEELEGHNFAWRVIYLCRNLFWSKLPSLTICPPPPPSRCHTSNFTKWDCQGTHRHLRANMMLLKCKLAPIAAKLHKYYTDYARI